MSQSNFYMSGMIIGAKQNTFEQDSNCRKAEQKVDVITVSPL